MSFAARLPVNPRAPGLSVVISVVLHHSVITRELQVPNTGGSTSLCVVVSVMYCHLPLSADVPVASGHRRQGPALHCGSSGWLKEAQYNPAAPEQATNRPVILRPPGHYIPSQLNPLHCATPCFQTVLFHARMLSGFLISYTHAIRITHRISFLYNQRCRYDYLNTRSLVVHLCHDLKHHHRLTDGEASQ
jgi:hypothetical protein